MKLHGYGVCEPFECYSPYSIVLQTVFQLLEIVLKHVLRQMSQAFVLKERYTQTYASVAHVCFGRSDWKLRVVSCHHQKLHDTRMTLQSCAVLREECHHVFLPRAVWNMSAAALIWQWLPTCLSICLSNLTLQALIIRWVATGRTAFMSVKWASSAQPEVDGWPDRIVQMGWMLN